VPLLRATSTHLPASRYSSVPIVLIDAAAIVAVDSCTRRGGIRALAATLALSCALAAGWITDFRYSTGRGSAALWPPVARSWLAECDRAAGTAAGKDAGEDAGRKAGQGAAEVMVPAWGESRITIDCSRLRR
jgi:hypothetical protein